MPLLLIFFLFVAVNDNYKKGKKVVTSLAVLAGLASGAGALNAFANKTVKAMLYRHHKEDENQVF